MSSKFFTWTKGDRRNASEALYTGGVVPIPVECIHIKGFDYSRTPKLPKNAQHRPLPLTIDPSHELESSYGHLTDDSTALQDAAVKSATSLIAVVNDMLRSPHPSGLAPSHGRPRSHTAPPTPMPEAPSHPPVELPGSIPDRPRAAHHYSFDGQLKRVVSPNHEQQTSTSARRSTHPWLHRLTASMDKPLPMDQTESISYDCNTPKVRQGQKSRKSASVVGPKQPRGALPSEKAQYPALPSQDVERVPVSLDQALHDSKPLSLTSGDRSSADWPSPRPRTEQLQQEEPFMAQISSLRMSHEAQLQALREAHRQEVASSQQYIAFLEQHGGIRCTNGIRACSRSGQVLDFANETSCNIPRHSAGINATMSRSLTSPKDQGSGLQSSICTNSLGLQQDSHCQSTARCGEAWLECNRLRDAVQAHRLETLQSRQIIQRLEASETSLKNTVADLQSRLSDANNTRLDVQERLHEACERVRKLTDREATVLPEIGAMQNGEHKVSVKTVNLHSRSRHNRARSDLSCQSNKAEPPLAPINGLRNVLSEKGENLEQLELQHRGHQAQRSMMQTRASVPCGSAQLSTNVRIREESLRQPCTPTQAGMTQSDNTAQARPIGTTEHHYRKQKVSKGYERTQGDIEVPGNGVESSEPSLRQENHHPRPRNKSVPSSPAAPPTPSPSLSPTRTPSPSALGISLPQTPRTVSTATAEALLLSAEDALSFTQPRTPPLYLQKKLPKPPSLGSNPPPAYSPALCRGETMKSVGESIIELYARRDGENWGSRADELVEWL